MKAISKLKDEARRHEQNDAWDKAIQAYLQVLRVADEGEGEVELPLYNRIGDLYVRLGRPQEGVSYYEQAADRYADAGLYNNAIALCNKALRYNADNLELIRKLGRFSASQGFLSDARRHFLDFAERSFRAGLEEDGFSALEELARASDDAEMWELLGRRLQQTGRTDRAVRELQRAYALRRAADDAAADALRDEIRQLDPDAVLPDDEPESFVDSSFDDEADPANATLEPLPVLDADEAAATEAAGPDGDGEPDREPAYDAADYEQVDDDGLGLETDYELDTDDTPDAGRLEGFESTALTDDDHDVHAEALPGLQTDRHEPDDAVPPSAPPVEGLESTAVDFSDVDEAADDFDIEREDAPDWSAADDDAEPADPFAGLPTLDDAPEDAQAEDADSSDPFAGLPTLDDVPDDARDEDTEPADPFAGLPTLDDEDEYPDDVAGTNGSAALAGMPDLDEPPQVAVEPAQPEPARDVPDDDGFVDLASFLQDDVEDTTRFRVQEAAPSGDEDHDFAELLNQFKAKLSAHVPAEDAAAHYDLGLAFKEMGLIDEAIAEFQVALRAGHMRLKVLEELGQCFLQKNQHNIAEKVLRRALALSHADELELLGVYYYLGRAYEHLERHDQARDAYERVLGLDINFRDAAERLGRL